MQDFFYQPDVRNSGVLLKEVPDNTVSYFYVGLEF